MILQELQGGGDNAQDRDCTTPVEHGVQLQELVMAVIPERFSRAISVEKSMRVLGGKSLAEFQFDLLAHSIKVHFDFLTTFHIEKCSDIQID